MEIDAEPHDAGESQAADRDPRAGELAHLIEDLCGRGAKDLDHGGCVVEILVGHAHDPRPHGAPGRQFRTSMYLPGSEG